MTQLALTLRHHVDETPYSIASRLATINGSMCGRDFSADMGINWSSLTRGDTDAIGQLAEVAGLEVDALLAANVSHASEAGFLINNHHFKGRQILRNKLQVCPRCILEDARKHGPNGPYGRIQWAISAYRVCSIHGILLVQLPTPDYPLSPFDVVQRIAGYISDPGNAAKSDTMRYSVDLPTYIEHRLTGGRHDAWLDALGLDLILYLCQTLGALLTYGSKKGVSQCNFRELAVGAEKGFQALAGGQQSLTAALFGVIKNGTTTTSGPTSDFGIFLSWLKALDRDCPRNALLLDFMAEFMFSTYAYGNGSTLLGRTCKKRRNHNPISLSDQYGVSISTARRFLRSLSDTAFAKRRSILPVDVVEPVMQELSRGLRMCQSPAGQGFIPPFVCPPSHGLQANHCRAAIRRPRPPF